MGPSGLEASPQLLLLASQTGERTLGLTPVLGDPETAAPLSGLLCLLCFGSPPCSARCPERGHQACSWGPVLPGLCSSPPQFHKFRVAKEGMGVPEDQRSAGEADSTTSRGVTHTQQSPGWGGARLAR